MISHSSSDKCVGFFNTFSGIPILPTSCNNAPNLILWTSASGKFNALANASEYLETDVEWPFVYGSFASIAPAKEVANYSKWCWEEISSLANLLTNSSSKLTPNWEWRFVKTSANECKAISSQKLKSEELMIALIPSL